MNESQPYNPDDELLSAYLDGELAPEERARVESRLASDPEARHLLEELRAASKALQGLPSAAIDHSLREAVLERVAKATNSDDDAPIAPTGAPVGPQPPGFTIGRTRRSWFWASLAVAAGLLIMFTQGDQDEQPEESVLVARRDLERAAPAAANSAAERADDESIVALHDDGLVFRAAPPESGVSRRREERAAESVVSGGDSPAIAASEPSSAAPAHESSLAPTEEQLLVVHVLARPEAIQNRAFEKLLVSNGIALDPTSSTDGEASGAPAGDNTTDARGSIRAGSSGAGASQQLTEAVLVEAPAPQILSCLADLNRDAANYLGLEIEDISDQRARKIDNGKGVLKDFGKFNRGRIPAQQKLFALKQHSDYYAKSASGSAAAGDEGGKSTFNYEAAQDRFGDAGRAQRVDSLPREIETKIVQNATSASEAPVNLSIDEISELHKLQRELKLPHNGDNLQVWFLLSPTSAPASPPSGDSNQ